MKAFHDSNYRASIPHHLFRFRAVGIATVAVLVLFYSFTYQSTHLSTFHLSDPPSAFVQEPQRPPPPLKAAIIIEGRTSPNLIPLILHFSSVLGPEWPIKVLHRSDNRDQFLSSSAFQRQILSGHITLQQLPSNVTLTSREAVSKLLTEPGLYRSLAPYKHLLFFQSDSILCANSPRMVEDFLQYDFIGAPIDAEYGHGMNGGLSLRNREKMLEVLGRSKFTGSPENGSEFEDQWFYQKLSELPVGPHNETGANLPSREVAAEFSVETIWKQQPFGLHQVSRWQAKHMKELDQWCPEYRIAGDVAFPEGASREKPTHEH
ncbi:MAG: hypothetical protein Q9169_000127 [Polycauliona sp. 2 TL-2023]